MRSPRAAFTIVELLVALILMAVAASGLVSALTGNRQLRNLAASHAFAADHTRERLEWLAALPCSGPTEGSSVAAWGAEHWRATPASIAWNLTDSLLLVSARAPVVIEARVACP